MNVVWAIRRIQAMGVAEMVHRVWRLLTQHTEGILLRTGWAPRLKGKVRNSHVFNTANTDIRESWFHNFELDVNRLDELVEGRIELLSYKNIVMGNTIDWLTEPVNGVRTPFKQGKKINYRDKNKVGDIKIIWELGRQQYLVPLTVGYLLTGDARYKETIKKHIESWIESCPFGYTVHWCSSLEVALRIISWSIVHGLLILGGEKHGLYDLVDNKRHLRDILFQHAWFIRHFLSLHSSANNHLIGELTGLWTVCNVFDLGEKGRQWTEFAGNYLEKEACKQVYQDGVNKEQAIYYHYWVLEYLLFSYLIGVRAGREFTDAYVKRIADMARFLDELSPNGGVPPQIGDADDGFVSRLSISGLDEPFCDILSSCNQLISRQFDSEVTEKSFWYSLIAGVQPGDYVSGKDIPRSKYPKIFAAGGYAILGDDVMHTVFDAGSLGYTSIAAHGHADALSICLAIEDAWWLVDPGTYTYHDNKEWRNYFRGTAAHNTVMVDNMDQSRIAGDFLWSDHAHAMLLEHGGDTEKQWALGSHDGYSHLGVSHQRKIEYYSSLRKLMVIDALTGEGVHNLCWHFHLGPDVWSERDGVAGNWILQHRNSKRKLIVSGGSYDNWSLVKGSTSPIMGWYSEALGSKIPCEVLKYHHEGLLADKSTFTFTLE